MIEKKEFIVPDCCGGPKIIKMKTAFRFRGHIFIVNWMDAKNLFGVTHLASGKAVPDVYSATWYKLPIWAVDMLEKVPVEKFEAEINRSIAESERLKRSWPLCFIGGIK